MALKMSLSFIEAFRNKLLETAASNQVYNSFEEYDLFSESFLSVREAFIKSHCI